MQPSFACFRRTGYAFGRERKEFGALFWHLDSAPMELMAAREQ